MDTRIGRQTPTTSLILPYKKSHGVEAIKAYEETGRHAIDWQKLIVNDILAVGDDGLYVHSKFGYAVPRQNGKNEIAAIVELYGLEEGLKILHTAHRTTTSHVAWERLCALLDAKGYKSAQAVKKEDNVPEELLYDSYKAFGLESITLRKNGAKINFRTRSSKGGLGETYDILVVDEAQEYTDDQDSALKYVVAASLNPLTIYCGTPPTPFSVGTVFTKFRKGALNGELQYSGWAEWSVDKQENPRNKESWYLTNPSLGHLLSERTIESEIGTDDIDFNVQRLGYWIKYNQKSAITENEWLEMEVETLPELTGKLFAGVKYGHDGKNVALSIAVKTADKNIFIESIDCRPVSAGYDWIVDFLKEADIQKVVIDGASGQQLLASALKEQNIKPTPILPTVKEIIVANADFEQGVYGKKIQHMNQPSLTQVVSNCEKRNIGSNGGFGYRSIMEETEIALMDSVILAYWVCKTAKPKKIQKISY